MDIYDFFTENEIDYERHDHPAVFTVEESNRLVPPLNGAKTKNLFLRDKKGKQHFLVVMGHEKNVDLKSLSVLLGVNNLSLASPERLEKYLGVQPGAVSLLGILNDSENKVRCILDESIWSAQFIQCHPLVNTSTLVIPHEDLEKLLELTGHNPEICNVPTRDLT